MRCWVIGVGGVATDIDRLATVIGRSAAVPLWSASVLGDRRLVLPRVDQPLPLLADAGSRGGAGAAGLGVAAAELTTLPPLAATGAAIVGGGAAGAGRARRIGLGVGGGLGRAQSCCRWPAPTCCSCGWPRRRYGGVAWPCCRYWRWRCRPPRSRRSMCWSLVGLGEIVVVLLTADAGGLAACRSGRGAVTDLPVDAAVLFLVGVIVVVVAVDVGTAVPV